MKKYKKGESVRIDNEGAATIIKELKKDDGRHLYAVRFTRDRRGNLLAPGEPIVERWINDY